MKYYKYIIGKYFSRKLFTITKLEGKLFTFILFEINILIINFLINIGNVLNFINSYRYLKLEYRNGITKDFNKND